MVQKTLDDIFNGFLSRESIFVNKEALQARYQPKTLLHREKLVADLAAILAPSLRGELCSNIFVYGTTGTGKTSVMRWVADQLAAKAAAAAAPLKVIYVNIKLERVADTEYRLFAFLGEQLGASIPTTGLPTSHVFEVFKKVVETQEGVIIVILDEVDRLISKTGDDVLYNLTRMNADLARSKVCIAGITNDLKFLDALDPRVRSSLSEEEIIFPPYNALQLQDILAERASIAFKAGAVDEAVIKKAAAQAAREHGDARKALDLLRVAGELAERAGERQVTLAHLDLAESRIDSDRILETVKSQPRQSKAVLFSIMRLSGEEVSTGDVYETYRRTCQSSGLSVLTPRRVSDLISELDMLGIVSATKKSLGRYGRTRFICLHLPAAVQSSIDQVLSTEFGM
jgi:cell division control protein 6